MEPENQFGSERVRQNLSITFENSLSLLYEWWDIQQCKVVYLGIFATKFAYNYFETRTIHISVKFPYSSQLL